MDAVFKKLNYKEHTPVFVLNAPESFNANLESIADQTTINRTISENDAIEFVIGFATKQTEVDEIANLVAPKLKGDATFWICYPKGTSKNYTCDFNRDTGWKVVGAFGLEPVRQVAIDADWSALRFRKVTFIKTLSRREGMALSAEGKARTQKNAKR